MSIPGVQRKGRLSSDKNRKLHTHTEMSGPKESINSSSIPVSLQLLQIKERKSVFVTHKHMNHLLVWNHLCH